MTIKQELTNLKEIDLYSLLLFVLYKIKDIEEYSTLSELIYVLDKENFLSLCEYFGGLTITIPKIEDVKSLINSLLLYQYVEIDGWDYDEAVKTVGFNSSELRTVKKEFNKIKEVISNYKFTSR